MAYTVAVDKKTVHGDERTLHLTITPDAATGNVDTGLESINGFSIVAASAASDSWHVRKNTGAESTAIAGTLGFSGVSSGDEFAVTVWGR